MSGTLAVKLTWERLGRKASNPRHDGYEEIVTVVHRDDLGAAIWRIANRWLMSGDFAVSVHDDGTFSVEGDRFGKGRWAVVTTVSDGSAP